MTKVLVVLGHQTDSLRETRVRRAVRYLEEHPYEVALVVFTGWNGEAEAMCRLAFPNGPESVAWGVACEHQSKHTLENAAYTAELLAARGYPPTETDLVVVTNPFHTPRAFLTFRRFFPRVAIAEAAEGIPSDQPNLIGEELRKVVAYSLKGDLYPACLVRAAFEAAVRVNP